MDAPEQPLDANELLAIIDRLEDMLERSQLSELEVEADGTAVVLRTRDAVLPLVSASVPAAGASSADASARPATEEPARPLNAVTAPLTGLFYGSPSPGAEPYVKVGSEIHAGQVIGLIEAMKLFNEIKSDLDGRVTRIHVADGALVKAKQPLIEVEPA